MYSMFILFNKIIIGLNALHITSLPTIKSRTLSICHPKLFSRSSIESIRLLVGCFCHFLDNSAIFSKLNSFWRINLNPFLVTCISDFQCCNIPVKKCAYKHIIIWTLYNLIEQSNLRIPCCIQARIKIQYSLWLGKYSYLVLCHLKGWIFCRDSVIFLCVQSALVHQARTLEHMDVPHSLFKGTV